MASISSYFAWKKDYTVLQEDGQLLNRQLNFFQRRFRGMGFYKNTHLATVAALAQKAYFKPDSDGQISYSIAQRTVLLGLIGKAKEKNKLGATCLGEAQLSRREIVRYEGSVIDRDGCTFTVKIIKDNKIIRKAFIAINKVANELDNVDQSGRSLDISSLYEVGGPRYNSRFITDPNDELAKHTYLFLAKILNDSKKLEQLNLFGSQVGGALLANKYGFTGEIKEYEKINGKQIGKVDGLTLVRSKAEEFEKECLLQNPVSMDFFIHSKPKEQS